MKRRVLLVEVEGRDGIAGLLGIPPPGFEERRTRFGFSVLSITPKEALLEYLWLFFRMRALARSLRNAKAIDVATDAVPGFRDVMVAGKLFELTEWRERGHADHGRIPYDFVVVDAPPTGQLVPFLRSPAAYRDLIRVGRPHRQLDSIDRLIHRDARITLVTVPEEMSVAETLETTGALREAGLPDASVVMNQVQPPPFPSKTRTAGMRMDGTDLAGTLRAAGSPAREEDADDLVRVMREMDGRVREQRRHIGRLSKSAPVTAELPFVYSESFGPDQVASLAELLS
jgi:anion-transporting  ArsA/GET3 family ATPase